MRIKRDGTDRQIIVNHEHSSEITFGTWVSGIFHLNFELNYYNYFLLYFLLKGLLLIGLLVIFIGQIHH